MDNKINSENSEYWIAEQKKLENKIKLAEEKYERQQVEKLTETQIKLRVIKILNGKNKMKSVSLLNFSEEEIEELKKQMKDFLSTDDLKKKFYKVDVTELNFVKIAKQYESLVKPFFKIVLLKTGIESLKTKLDKHFNNLKELPKLLNELEQTESLYLSTISMYEYKINKLVEDNLNFLKYLQVVLHSIIPKQEPTIDIKPEFHKTENFEKKKENKK